MLSEVVFDVIIIDEATQAMEAVRCHSSSLCAPRLNRTLKGLLDPDSQGQKANHRRRSNATTPNNSVTQSG